MDYSFQASSFFLIFLGALPFTEPIRNNPGNKFYRSIIDKYYSREFEDATDKRKADMKLEVLNEIAGTNRRFFIIDKVNVKAEEKGQGNSFIYVVREADASTTIEKIGRAFLDTPKRRCNYWSWRDRTSDDADEWTSFGDEGIRLEKMYQNNAIDNKKIEVFVAQKKHIVDLNSWKMHELENEDRTFDVRREIPDLDSGTRPTPIMTTNSDRDNC